jgi:hypothetical protein
MARIILLHLDEVGQRLFEVIGSGNNLAGPEARQMLDDKAEGPSTLPKPYAVAYLLTDAAWHSLAVRVNDSNWHPPCPWGVDNINEVVREVDPFSPDPEDTPISSETVKLAVSNIRTSFTKLWTNLSRSGAFSDDCTIIQCVVCQFALLMLGKHSSGPEMDTECWVDFLHMTDVAQFYAYLVFKDNGNLPMISRLLPAGSDFKQA